MRRIVAGAAVVGLLCAGCSGSGEGETVEITTTDRAGQPTVITQEATEAPEETPEQAAPTTAALMAHLFDVPGGTQIAMDLPEDWVIQPLGEAVRLGSPITDAVAPRQWCLVPPTAPPAIEGCAGVLLAAGPDWLPGAAGAAYTPRQVDGWRSTTGALTCPFTEEGEPVDTSVATAVPDESADEAAEEPDDGAGDDAAVTEAPADADDTAEPTVDESEVDVLVTASEGLPLTSVQTEVGGRQVTYETWRAACSLSEDIVITPQVWHDTELRVLFRDYFGMPETAVIVESLRPS